MQCSVRTVERMKRQEKSQIILEKVFFVDLGEVQ